MIDTDGLAARYRSAIIDVDGKRLLVARLAGSPQESDLTEAPNAQGLGRVRHFRRGPSPDWIPNPLPIDPACARLQTERPDKMNAQVFQNAACSWRCWYCFVPYELLSASVSRSEWRTAAELVGLFAAVPERPPILDLSGGQPDLTPEWVPWTMDALDAAGLSASTYLWSDDNLSNDYFWRFLPASTRERIVAYPRYGRVGCFKGIDDVSFQFNTQADAPLYSRQFEVFGKLLETGIDLYAYVTLTHPHRHGVAERVRAFVDRLQSVDEALPLRTVPLEVFEYGPVHQRLDADRRFSIETGQYVALDAWRAEIGSRFSASDLKQPIDCVRWSRNR